MLSLIFLAVVTLSHATAFEQNKHPSAYGYIREVAIPLGEKIRRKEDNLMNQEVFGRITGGSISNEGQFPYQAGVITNFIGIEGTGACGGSLISVNRVVHAAHCWYDGKTQGYIAEIVLGSITLYYGGIRQNTTNIVTHPQWNPRTFENDIAVIYLTTSVQISDNIAPIALPSGGQLNETFVDETALATGYGNTGIPEIDVNTLQRTLRYVNLTVITNEICSYFYYNEVEDSKLCTIGENGANICGGDSGGPLVITRNQRPVLVGISSYGSNLGACAARRPSVFTRVSLFIDFINEHM